MGEGTWGGRVWGRVVGSKVCAFPHLVRAGMEVGTKQLTEFFWSPQPAPPETPPETLMASKRKAYHKRYLAEQEYWKENEERLKKEREDKGDQVLQDLTEWVLSLSPRLASRCR